ncbi:hypothetical protein LWF15_17230 [Kineosporia rhizophila]|uniref:QsdR family transcriptional regulator n=1 Tax=Kineosporia TaxID=49184 RepID=UPI001E53562F|nr:MULTISPECIES: QsdR family transcriptional regulator [Kineosporia]MCE0537247.1 hypothetical protein [Kineosporia rhizophila]GLY15905.1 hypothetical protein Kisp01_29200 [Kineosporia sp. NBRC 101677]
MPTSRPVLAPEVVLRGAAIHFARHCTLDMDLLATELAVSRATLYRAVGSRDKLLGEVFGMISRRLFQIARARVGRVGGAEDVLAVTRSFVGMLELAHPLRTFMAEEPQIAARVLFTTAGDVMRRSVAEQAQIFREAGVGGPQPLGRALLYVRLVESVIFAELLGAGPVELADAEPALRALLE